MPKITHISTRRTVQTKNWERKIYEVIVDWHQIALRRPLGKTVNEGDEIEYMKNDKWFYVEKSKEKKQDEFIKKLEGVIKTMEEMLVRIEKLEEMCKKDEESFIWINEK